MSTPSERLRTVAREAIDQYNAETAGGGEPPYPDWADDILVMLGRVANLEQAHQQDVERVIKERLPDGRKLGINWYAVKAIAEGGTDPRYVAFNAAEVMAIYHSAPGLRPMFVPFNVYRALLTQRDDLWEAAIAVVRRWDTPAWKDAEPTADVINKLRVVLAGEQGGHHDIG